jgi:hypothetical protein
MNQVRVSNWRKIQHDYRTYVDSKALGAAQKPTWCFTYVSTCGTVVETNKTNRNKGGAMNNKWLSVKKQIEIIALSGVRTNGEISAISAAKFADGREGVVVHYDNGAVRKIAVGQDRVEVTYLATRR